MSGQESVGIEQTPEWDETPVGGYPSAARHQSDADGGQTPQQHAHAIHEVADELDEIQSDLPEAFDEPLERVERSLREAADAARLGIDEEHAIRFLMFDNIGLSPDEEGDR